MMKWEMAPSNYFHYLNWVFGRRETGNWTLEENKQFEIALASYDSDNPDRWKKVAAMIPGKTEADVRRHYDGLVQDVSCIEAGLFQVPGHNGSPFTLDLVNKRNLEGLKSPFPVDVGKRSAARHDQERKKGVPWTEDEHRRFLLGLNTYGKGDWRNISRNSVFTRTPTQVASHAQKYFIRQNSGGKDKKRSSIHDITTISISDCRSPSVSQYTNAPLVAGASAARTSEHMSAVHDSHQSNEGAAVFSPTYSQAHGNPFNFAPSELNSRGFRLQTQNFQRGLFHEPQVFQVQPSYRGPHG